MAEAVLVLYGALQHAGEDLHIGVRVGGESATRRNQILIDHPQYRVPHPLRVIVVTEGETVARVQPAKVGLAPRFCGSQLHHGLLLTYRDG